LTTLINALRPPGLESRTLANAIRENVNVWSRQNNIASELRIDSTITVNQKTEQAFFRVLQESLANVARHSKADKVTVELKSENDAIVLIIEDNGIGFDAKQIIKGIGLESMQERLNAVNGKVDVISEKTKGTQVTAKVRIT
jgi:NarL family two-component system sensor histidine kinase LiaS